MKSFSPGLSDSIASVIADPPRCPHCDSSSRIVGGLCIGCLLESGLDPADDCEPEALVRALAEISLPDQNWRLGNYEILEEIGRGGMGVIYRARQRHSRRIVAVKRVLSYHSDSRETLARFRREAQAAASLDHPNILPIYEVSESEDGLPFFSMKFAPGGTLQQVAPALRTEPRQCVALVAKIARAVQYAHSRGILHRDLKPGNILLDGRGEPLVSDFGLAKWLDTTSDLTRTLTIFGTPGYIAPEQASASAAELKPTSDVYSLGAILFDLLAGRPPFLGTHALSVIRQAAESPAPKLRSLSKVADRDLETICSRCLDREPSARYLSAHDLATDLVRWLEGRSIIARPVSLPVKAWRWSKRNPKLASIGLICVLLGGVSVLWQKERLTLQSQVWEEQTVAHSIGVLPFLDLDTVGPDFEPARAVANALGAPMQTLGPGRLDTVQWIPKKWTGIGTADELQDSADRLKCRFVLSGTTRQLGEATRISLHLIKVQGTEPLGSWTFDFGSAHAMADALAARQFAAMIYQRLDAPKEARGVESPTDPGLTNDTARELIIAGKWLIDRGRASVADMDRAISCLENAIQLEPRSAVARAYLAMACLGRDVNSPNEELATRALKEARLAIELAPSNELANRALRVVYATNGHYSEALEQGLRSLELTEQSERTFGHIAYLWGTLGRPDKAIAWYGRAKATGQQLADYEALLGDSWSNLELDREAELAYQNAIKLRSDLPDGVLGLSHLRLIQRRTDEARSLCHTALSNYPSSPHPLEVLAQIEFFGRNYSAAGKLYETLKAENPRGGTKGESYGAIDYGSAIAKIKLENGDVKGARSLLDECASVVKKQLAEAPQSPPALYRLAAIESMQDDTAAALTHLQAAVNAGWVDFRSTRLDPRFDRLSKEERFLQILSGVATRMATLSKSELLFREQPK